MTNKKALKRALVLSIVSIIVCISMFAGTTYAWFTDTASNTGNRIVSGTLKVDLLKYTGNGYTSIKDGEGNIFGSEDATTANADETNTLWEPGKTQIVYLGVRNLGNLAIKYNVVLDIIDLGLVGSLEYAIINGTHDEIATNAATATLNWETIKAAATAANAENVGDVEMGQITAAQNGHILPTTAVEDTDYDATDYFALAVHMKEDAGNEYQDKDVVIDVTVVATQYTYEEDSFNDQYDADAEFPEAPAAAIVDGVEYATVAEAFANAPTGSTIVLQKNVSDGAGLVVPDRTTKEITFDLNGYIYTVEAPAVGSTGTESQAMHFSSGSTVTIKNGTFVASNDPGLAMALQEYGTLTFQNCTVDVSNIAVDTYGDYTGTRYASYSFLEIPLFNANDEAAVITFDSSTLILPAACTKGAYVLGTLNVINGSTIVGPACIEGNGKIVVDATSTITGGVVPYFAADTIVSAEDAGVTTYTLQ